MTTRRTPKPKTTQADTQTVTVEVVEPHAVYFDGRHRTGTIQGVPADQANAWARHGWATVTE